MGSISLQTKSTAVPHSLARQAAPVSREADRPSRMPSDCLSLSQGAPASDPLSVFNRKLESLNALYRKGGIAGSEFNDMRNALGEQAASDIMGGPGNFDSKVASLNALYRKGGIAGSEFNDLRNALGEQAAQGL